MREDHKSVQRRQPQEPQKREERGFHRNRREADFALPQLVDRRVRHQDPRNQEKGVDSFVGPNHKLKLKLPFKNGVLIWVLLAEEQR